MINARNLAAILTSRGADVESALLELAAVAPSLDVKVRRALFWHNGSPKLRRIDSRNGPQLYYTEYHMTRPVCAMHAVDQIGLVLDDAQIVKYLQSKFPNWETLCLTSS